MEVDGGKVCAADLAEEGVEQGQLGGIKGGGGSALDS